MKLISKFDKGFKFLLCVIDTYSKYAWVNFWNAEKGITIINAFQKIPDELKRKTKKIWVDKGNEFCNRSMKSCLQDNDREIYPMHNEGKSVITKRFIKILKNKIFKYMT